MAKRRVRIDTALLETNSPVFALDRLRQVVFFNHGCEQLTGWSADDVIGETCHFASGADAKSIAALTGALCPPPEVLQGEQVSVAKYFCHRASGHSQPRLVHYFPLGDEHEMTYVLAVITAVPKSKITDDISGITQMHAELASLRQTLRERFRLSSLVARLSPMLRVLEQVNAARQSMVSVHICGEPGTGKEQVARAIHYESDQSAKAFVPIDCQHLPAHEVKETLVRMLETDWGEMTPILALQPGCVYLKHVDALPRDLQQKLVDFHRSDRAAAFRSRVRLITSAHSDLAADIRDERLTDEFYYLITGLRIDLPPLRQRLEEFRLLAQHFLEACNRTSERQVSGISPDVWQQLEAYNWPGNLDELRQVLSEAHAACDGTVIGSAQLPFRFRTGLDAQALGPAPAGVLEPLESVLARVERQQIESALQQARGNKAKAAKLLGITRHSLYRRMESLGIVDEDSDVTARDDANNKADGTD